MNDENLTLKEIQLFVSNLQSRTCKIESDQATIIARDSVVNDVIRNIEDRTKSRIPITNRMVVSYTKNFINNLLNIASVGDQVICIERSRTSSWFVKAEVIGFTAERIKLKYDLSGKVHLKSCDKIIKI